MIGMKDSELWAHGFRWDEQLKVVDDISHSKSWAQGSKCYKQLSVVVVEDMRYFRSWA